MTVKNNNTFAPINSTPNNFPKLPFSEGKYRKIQFSLEGPTSIHFSIYRSTIRLVRGPPRPKTTSSMVVLPFRLIVYHLQQP